MAGATMCPGRSPASCKMNSPRSLSTARIPAASNAWLSSISSFTMVLALTISRAPPGNIVALARRERGLARDQIMDERGDFFHTARTAHRNLTQHIVQGGLRNIIQDRGPDHRRRDAVHGDVALSGNLFRQRLGQRDYGGFGARVRNERRVAFLARDGGDVNNAPVMPLEHLLNHGAAYEENALEIDGINRVEVFFVEFPEHGGLAGNAGVVHDNVNRAKRPADLRDPGADRSGHGHVALHTEAADALRHRRRAFVVQVEYGDTRPGFHQAA